MTMKAYNEACRGLLYDTAAAGEGAHTRHNDSTSQRPPISCASSLP